MTRFNYVAAMLMAICLGFGCAQANDSAAPPMSTQDFTFTSGGLTLSGIMDQPTAGQAEALVIFVHGYGRTDLRGQNMYYDLRSRFAELGITRVV